MNLIFYFGHTATFFINKLLLAGIVDKRINPRFESVFAVGVDEMSWDDLSEARHDWPSVAEVREYRQTVRSVVDRLIRTMPLALPINWAHPWWILLMGIEHERIHLETSSVLIRQHELKYVKPHPAWEPCRKASAAPTNELVEISSAEVHLGRDKEDPFRYGWDNEFGTHHANVSPFKTGRYLVSNGEFLSFIRDFPLARFSNGSH